MMAGAGRVYVGVGVFVGSNGSGRTGAVMLVSRVVSLWSAATWLLVSGARGDPGDGLARARRMLRMPALMMLLDDANSMVTLVGNHDTVSQACVARVAQIQMVKHR